MWFYHGFDNHKDMCSKRIGVHAPKYDTHSKFNNQHNWMDLYDQFMSMIIFTSPMSGLYIQAPTTMKKVATASIRIC